ncbi:MAG: hypothetical protein NT175_07310 [Bacteroidetes bacterium]|nr:hypothetical protein [Bacteroidota bacterium]
MRNVDPEYAYLTNGLYMSLGHLNVYHIDNPGTPLQIVVAFVCRIVYFIRSPHISYLEDVMMNSDLYLNIINHVVISITAVVLFIAGVLAWRITGFLPYGLLIQTAPFYSNITYDIIGRLTPELLIPIPVLLLSIMILKVVKSNTGKFNFLTILLFGLISGFGLSIKLTYFPLLIIPFIIIPGYKDKVKFLILSILSMFVFAMPILYDLVFFTRWIKDLIIHSGHYGNGEANVLVWSQFIQNLETFYKFHSFLVFMWFISLFLLMISLIYKRKEINNRLTYGMTGVLIVILVQVILVSKHYEYRYLVPGLALFPVLTILSFEILKNMIRFKRINIIIGLMILAGSVYCIPKQVQSIRIRSRNIFTEMQNKMVTKHFVGTLPEDAIKLLTPSGYGCPFHDFSIMISHCWAGRENEVFMPVYKKLYPDTYQYFTWENRSKYWDEYDISSITCTNKPVYFYIAGYTPELDTTSLSAILPGYPIENIKQELVFENLKTNEKIFKLKFPDPTSGLSHVTSQ